MQSKILVILVLVLGLIIILQRCGGGHVDVNVKPKIDTVKIHDTISIRDTVPGKPVLVKVKGDKEWIHDTLYAPSGNYNVLLAQYDSLGDKYFSRNIYKTPFKLGSYGSAEVTDTIVSNKLVASGIVYNIRVPREFTTITIHDPVKPVRQMYIGGGILSNKTNIVSGAFGQVLYKDRQDRIFGVSTGYNNGLTFGLSTYWKIKL